MQKLWGFVGVIFFNLLYTLVGGARTQFSHSFPVCSDKPVSLFKGGVGEVVHVFSFLNNNN